MGVLANHVPSIEQLKPGLIEIVEESGSSKQFFRTFTPISRPDDGRRIVGGQPELTQCHSHSFRWIRRCPAQLRPEHQRRRGLPSRGLQR